MARSARVWHPLVRGLHWVMAGAIAGNLVLGLAMSRAAEAARDTGTFNVRVLGLGLFDAYQLHKSVGILVLLLCSLRLGLRLSTTAPAGHGVSPFLKRAAAAVQAGLYALMFAVPFSGWLLASSAMIGLTTVVFGLVPLPDLVGRDPLWEARFAWLHEVSAWGIVALVLLHAAAAFKHHLIDRDNTLRAMLGARWLRK